MHPTKTKGGQLPPIGDVGDKARDALAVTLGQERCPNSLGGTREEEGGGNTPPPDDPDKGTAALSAPLR